MSSEKLKDFLSANNISDPTYVTPNRDRIAYTKDSGGDGQYDIGEDDLKSNLKETLSKWTNYYTSDNPNTNRYVISPDQNEFNISSPGERPAISVGEKSAEKMYIRRTGQAGDTEITDDTTREIFTNYSKATIREKDSGLFTTFESAEAEELIDKNGNDSARTGHDVNQRIADTRIVSEVLKFNRFNPDLNSSPYIEPDIGTVEDVDNNSNIKTKSSKPLGRYQEEAGTVGIDTIKEAANRILNASAGIGVSNELALRFKAQYKNTDDVLDIQGREVTSGATDDFFSFDATDFKGALNSDTGGNTEYISVLNSPDAPFEKGAALEMIGLAISGLAAAIAASLAFEAIGGALEALKPGASLSEKEMAYGGASPRPMGSFRKKQASIEGLAGGNIPGIPSLFDILGIRPVNTKFEFALVSGIQVSAGLSNISGDGNLGTAFSESLDDIIVNLINVVTTPGFYAIMTRNFVGSFEQLFRKIVDGLRSVDFTAAGAEAILDNIFSVIKVIRESKVIGFINYYLGLGDAFNTLREENMFAEEVFNKSIYDPVRNKISNLDAINLDATENREKRAGKSRTSFDKNSLAWATGILRSSMLMPENVNLARGYITQGKGKITKLADSADFVLENPEKSTITETAESRLSAEYVKEIEEALDHEYMPFYFHDLRTNEIVAFHAFLSSLSDSFTVNYDNTSAYGRADPVMIYNNTQRSISLSFHVVSTNSQDYDHMWTKINKLTTMLYPQYSRGTNMTMQIEGQDVNYTQPFSQVPTASPLIRVRLGDLFKSNYSKFTLMRLFGAHKISDISVNAPEGDPGSQLNPSSPIKVRLTSELKALGTLQKADGTPDPITISKDNIISLVKNADDKTCTITFEKVEFPEATVSIEYGKSQSKKYKSEQWVNITGTPRNIAAWSAYKSFTCNFEDVKSIIEFYPSKAQIEANVKRETFDTFTNPETNGIIRGFESTRGKGLACVITQCDFTWLEGMTWETETHKAPKVCLVNLTLSPIHDIAPGLDADGFNRAPIYPVGGFMKAVASDPYEF